MGLFGCKKHQEYHKAEIISKEDWQMITATDKEFFMENGYLTVETILSGTHLNTIQSAFDAVSGVECRWESG